MRTLPLTHPGTADHRSPARFLWWLVRSQWTTLLPAVGLGIVWMLCQAVMPAVIGAAIDRGVTTRDPSALLRWAGLMLGIGLLQAVTGILRHRFAVTNWLTAAYQVVQLVTRQAVRLGATLPRRVRTGEMVTIGASDLSHLGNAMDITARAAGAVASYVVVAVLLLQRSVTLGLLVLLGVPVVLLCLGPLLRPLQHRNLEQREMMSDLSHLATDIVAGLRVLRGVGGERVFRRRYAAESQRVRGAGVRVGRLQSVLDAVQVGLPGVFVVLVVWLGARLAVSGAITVGELVAFYGYAAFLMLPLRTLTEAISMWIRAYVAARRICRVLAVEPEITDPATPATPPPPGAPLVDVTSGVRVEAGELTALVSERPEETALVVDRLGRYADGDVRWGGVPLDRLPRDLLRRRIVVSETASTLFTGTLRAQIDLRGLDDAAVLQALHAAAAEDILEAVGGLDTVVVERGRSLSGGQRQRVVLARALALAPEVLLLVEPTSAVDAHTEARVADRLREHRRGLTTVLTSTSPLVLDRADTVLFLRDGVVEARGTHRALLAGNARYRAVVTREEEVPA